MWHRPDVLPLYTIQPYVAAYDTVPPEDFRIPEWIQETVYTRNTVNIRPHCAEYVRKIQNRLVQYKNEPEAYLQGESSVLILLSISSCVKYSVHVSVMLVMKRTCPCLTFSMRAKYNL